MSMNWERVKGVLESSDKVKEASKVGEEYAHDDYMFVSETKMAVGEEMVDLIQEEAEKNNVASIGIGNNKSNTNTHPESSSS